MSHKPVIRVRHVMGDRFRTIDGLKTVGEALGIIKESQANTLIVNKRHGDDEFGIVLLSDIVRKVLARDRSPDRTNVYEIMSKPVISVPPNMDVRYCARLLNTFDLSVVPVIENEEVLGIVGYRELVLDGLMALYE